MTLHHGSLQYTINYCSARLRIKVENTCGPSQVYHCTNTVRNDVLNIRSKVFIVFNWKLSLVIRVSAYKKFNSVAVIECYTYKLLELSPSCCI